MENNRRMTNEQYGQYVSQKTPKTHTLTCCIRAFFVGGAICVLGQLIHDLWDMLLPVEEVQIATLTSVTMIFLASLLTGIGVYDQIGKFAGAGSIIPITGFANSVVAPAMEFKSEGYIMGVGAKMFTLAGPVIVYGTIASVVVGVVYWVTTLF